MMRQWVKATLAALLLSSFDIAVASPQAEGLKPCGDAFYLPSKLSDPPYENYFYSDCRNISSQVVVTSPQPDSNLTIIGPRLLVAWPAGNSGVLAYLQPTNGKNGSLGIGLENFTSIQQPLMPIYESGVGKNPVVGVSGLLRVNSSARMDIAILGSIRTIRDFTEGPSILVPKIQDAIKYTEIRGGGVVLDRLWLDNVTTTTLSFSPTSKSGNDRMRIDNRTVFFNPGTYVFNASFNYPQLEQLTRQEVLNPASQSLISQNVDQTTSLSFLSYTNKLLAGAWRFLTYFGRDSMIATLLLQPVLSTGEGGAIEAVIGAALQRVNRTDGSVCHEETIGDYATYLNKQMNITSTMNQCDYKMIDSDYYLPVLMNNYFVATSIGKQRAKSFLSSPATAYFPTINKGLTYADTARITAEKIMNTSAPFAASGGQTKGNLVHLKEGQIVGQWRDSTYGIGGGRIPYDVNTALVPAALRAIASLSEAGFFPEHPTWKDDAARYAKVWEDNTLHFFEVDVPVSQAKSLVQNYVSGSKLPFPSDSSLINGTVKFHGLSLEGNNGQSVVRVMNSDDCFRHFLLNTTNDDQLSAFLNQTAEHILNPFPVGLSTDVGMLIANPAYGDNPVYAANWTNNAYHGTVVWGWPLAMMAAGLERQLERCSSSSKPAFCGDSTVFNKVKGAYNHLWDLIDANSNQLSQEVWSWQYRDGKFEQFALGSLPPPPGQSPTESDIRQLWSLTFLSVKRNEGLK
ncbi:glycogen debranching enzyme [Rhizodiscina lignyota]|uniref:Glycogen debranching enzyme n=1 Tax=Rhizodiscina lignyota TaxID=1504668 RepID=A0A9P4M872_9PEZI|nr:glycogen debranching enzyme [Rhizodiscina lignyota]